MATMTPIWISLAALTSSLVLLGVTAASDLRRRRIPNGVIALLAVVALLQWLFSSLQLTTGLTLSDVGANSLLLLLIILPGYMTGYLGAGDLKLLGVLALLWPPQLLLPAFAIGSILFPLAWLTLRPQFVVAVNADSGAMVTAHPPKRCIPMATALFTGAVLWLAVGGVL